MGHIHLISTDFQQWIKEDMELSFKFKQRKPEGVKAVLRLSGLTQQSYRMKRVSGHSMKAKEDCDVARLL